MFFRFYLQVKTTKVETKTQCILNTQRFSVMLVFEQCKIESYSHFALHAKNRHCKRRTRISSGAKLIEPVSFFIVTRSNVLCSQHCLPTTCSSEITTLMLKLILNLWRWVVQRCKRSGHLVQVILWNAFISLNRPFSDIHVVKATIKMFLTLAVAQYVSFFFRILVSCKINSVLLFLLLFFKILHYILGWPATEDRTVLDENQCYFLNSVRQTHCRQPQAYVLINVDVINSYDLWTDQPTMILRLP